MEQIKQIEAYKKMAEFFTEDVHIVENWKRCIEDPDAYYQENAERYQERGVEPDDDWDTIRWLGIADLLIESGTMVEFDHSDDLEDFLDGIHSLTSLPIPKERFDEEGDVEQWLKVLSDAWSDSGLVVAGMDIDSDSYCVFLIPNHRFDPLVALARQTGHKITWAQNL